MSAPTFARRRFLAGAAVAGSMGAVPLRAFAQPRVSRPLLIRDAYVMTMGPQGDLPRANILVRDGKILGIEADLAIADAETIDAQGQILLPGFVDTHTHLWLSQMRGMFGRSPETAYFPLTERLGAAYLAQDMRIGTLFGACGAVSAGITTTLAYCDNIRAPEDAEAALSGLVEAGVRARFLYSGHDKLAADQPLALDHLERLHRNRSGWAGEAPVDLGLGWRALTADAGADPLAVAMRDLAHARDLGLPISTHISGKKAPAQLKLLIERGLLGPDMLLVHVTDADARSLQAVKAADAAISLTPITEHRIGYGLTQINHYTARAGRVGLGIDGALAGAPDMFAVMRNAHMTQTAISRDEFAVSPREVLELATIGGARAIGMDDTIGSLEVGKRADLILVAPDALNMGFPPSDPSALLVYAAKPENVRMTLVDGRILKRDGQLAHLDERQVVEGARQSLTSILTRAGMTSQ